MTDHQHITDARYFTLSNFTYILGLFLTQAIILTILIVILLILGLNMKKIILALCLQSITTNLYATSDAVVNKWLTEFQPSTLKPEEQKKEFSWFMNAAKPYKGMTIRVSSEIIDTHIYEATKKHFFGVRRRNNFPW